AQEIGVASIRKIYQWADDHTTSGLNANIQWLRNEDVRGALIVDVPQLIKLKEAINQTSEEVEKVISVSGLLVGVDVVTRKFHMTFEDAEEMKGELSEALAEGGEIPVKHRYRATIRK